MSSAVKLHLVGTKDLGVVVEVAQRAQGMFVALELDEAVTQRHSHHLTLLRLLVIHHSTLKQKRRTQDMNTGDNTAPCWAHWCNVCRSTCRNNTGTRTDRPLGFARLSHLCDANLFLPFNCSQAEGPEFFVIHRLGQVMDTQTGL